MLRSQHDPKVNGSGNIKYYLNEPFISDRIGFQITGKEEDDSIGVIFLKTNDSKGLINPHFDFLDTRIPTNQATTTTR